jgi:hypothetical protein
MMLLIDLYHVTFQESLITSLLQLATLPSRIFILPLPFDAEHVC